MADISVYLAQILSAVYGEDVRGSIHDAIEIINDVSEVVLSTGTAVDSASSSSTGFFDDSLYLNTDTYELWKCVGTDTWQSLGILKGAQGDPGADGNRWFRGTGISGKAVNPTVYSGSGIADANVNDFYLNPSEGAVYHCVTGGDASTATWSYDFTMSGGGGGGSVVGWNQIQTSTGATKIAEITIDGSTTDVYAPQGGGGGSTTLAGLSDVNISSAANDQVLKYDSSSSKWVNGSAPAGGHTMIPTPDASVDESDVVSAVNGALTEGGTNDDVMSAYGVGVWSNVKEYTLLAHVDAGDDTVGVWNDGWESENPKVRTGWIYHECLYHMLTNDDIKYEIDFDVASGESVGWYAHRIDDEVTITVTEGGQTVTKNVGCIAIKLLNPVQTVGGIDVAVNVRINRTETVNNVVPAP